MSDAPIPPAASEAATMWFRVALEHVDEAIEVVDPDFHLLYVNPAWERMTGYSATEAVGHTPAELLRSGVHPAAFYDGADRQLIDGRPWSAIFSSRRKDGSLFLSELRGRPVADAAGSIRYLVAVRRDVGDGSSRAENADAQRYHLAALATRDGLLDWNMDAPDAYASLHLRELFGIGAVDPLPIAVVLDRVHDEDRPRLLAAFDLLRANGGGSFDLEHRVVPGSGRITWVHTRCFGTATARGGPTRAVAAVTDISDRKRSEAELFHSATHDSLTGLANRSLFLDRMQAAVRRAGRGGGGFALLNVDLRRFKQVNDDYGHGAGDGILAEVAFRLRRAVRPSDTVARLGGDEFAALLEGVVSADEAAVVARRVAKALDAPHRIVDRSVSVPATVGVALGDGQSEVDALMRAADTAMYEARATGAGDSVQLARPDTNARAAREARLARDLPDALPSAAVRLAYQPLVHLPSRRVVGAEGLARWKHPELGAIPPSEFVPLAEVRRLGPQLARMAIDSVARDLARWRASTRISPSFNVNINLTARQLAEPEVVEHVMGLCAGGELPRGCLGVEITETALFDRPDDMQKAIAELRKVGVHFALDDFGTGYSSLSHLVDYPVATVKIDRSLVARLGHDPVATHLVAGVLGLSDSLGLTVVAEGVETVDQERILVNLGCGLAQGWLYGRAVAASQFERLLVEAGHDDSGDVTAMLEEG